MNNQRLMIEYNPFGEEAISRSVELENREAKKSLPVVVSAPVYVNKCKECNNKKCSCLLGTEKYKSIDLRHFFDLKNNRYYCEKYFNGGLPILGWSYDEVHDFLPDLVSDIILEYLQDYHHFDYIANRIDPYHETLYRYYVKPTYLCPSKMKELLYDVQIEEKEDFDEYFDFDEDFMTKLFYDKCFQQGQAPFIYKRGSFKQNLAEFVYHHKFTTFSVDELSELQELISKLSLVKLMIYGRNRNMLRSISGCAGLRYSS
jgi:hypothetical protein